MTRKYFGVLVVVAAIAIATVIAMRLPGNPVVSTPTLSRAPQHEVPGVAESSEETPELPEQPPMVAEEVCRARFDGLTRRPHSDYRQIVQDVTEFLEASGDRELVLAAALTRRSREPERALQLMRRSGGESTADPLALWMVLDVCERTSEIDCDYTAIEQNIATRHGSNGAFWLALAGRMVEDGRDERAAEAIRQAISAPSYDSYLVDQLLTVERGLAASTDWTFAERIFQSIEYAHSTPSGIQSVIRRCESDNAGEWGYLCGQLAERLLKNDDDIVTRILGVELKKKLLEAHGEEAQLENIDSEMSRVKTVLEDEESAKEILNVLMNDETLLRTLIENLQSGGEIAAFERLADDIERLKATDGYDQCNFVVNPYVNTE